MDKGFSEVERGPLDETDWTNEADEIDALDERPRKSRVSKDTVRIPRTSRKPLVVLALLMLAGAAAYAFRDRIRPSGSMTNAPVPAPPPQAEPAKTTPEPAQNAATPKPKLEPAAADTSAKPAAGEPLLGLAPAASKAPLEKAAPTRTRLGSTASFANIPSEPMPSTPTPPPPAPVPAAAPAEATGDIEALLRDAQQAWSKQYYAVAIEKAEAALKIDPGRQTAYQIIAVCSCALRQADAAKQAVSHLHEHKRGMVQTLCQRHGVTLE